ncbi:complement inhibitor CirpT3-like [Leptinotarsa decemlineata]|uniref:complement inhibitor CirpT3-like n=1 Tax=Leptinotarsa decemlineata TaxID=7539 RepID=UPI003D3076C6
MKAHSILVICLIYVTVDAWEAISLYDPSTNHSGHCYYSEMSMKDGEVKRIEGQCATATCGSDRNVYLKGCGATSKEAPCKIVEDLSKPYPDCCPKLQCP